MSEEIHGKEQPEGGQTPDQDPEFDEVLSSFEESEARRRRKGLMYAGLVLLAIAGLAALFWTFRGDYFQGPVDPEAGEEEVIDETDDPECREMIASVEELSQRFFKLEPDIDEQLLADDPQAVEDVRADIAGLADELEQIEEESHEANLRFDESREELDAWFDYVKTELGFLDRIAEEQLAKLKEDGEDDKDEADQDDEERDDAVEEAGEQKNQKSLQERRDGALVAIHDAFQKFRVWHSSALHPCGPADEDEEPWRPDEDEGPAGGQAPPVEDGANNE